MSAMVHGQIFRKLMALEHIALVRFGLALVCYLERCEQQEARATTRALNMFTLGQSQLTLAGRMLWRHLP